MTDALAQHTCAAAETIAGDEKLPEWLLGAVNRMAQELGYVIRADARIPKRVELRQQLAAIRDASRLLDGLLFPFMHGGSSSLLLSDHLLREGEYRLEYEGQIHFILEDLIQRSNEALDRVPEGAGQGRTLSETVEAYTTPSGIICALGVQMLWREVRGRIPALNNEQAQRACSEVWLAAGGKGTKLTGWRTHMQEARTQRYASDGAKLARQIGVQGIHPETP